MNLNKTIFLALSSVFLLTACYPQIKESELPKTCVESKYAVAAAEYWLSQKFSNLGVFEHRPYQFRKNSTNDGWIISGTPKETNQTIQLRTFGAEIRMSDCAPLDLHSPLDIGE